MRDINILNFFIKKTNNMIKATILKLYFCNRIMFGRRAHMNEDSIQKCKKKNGINEE